MHGYSKFKLLLKFVKLFIRAQGSLQWKADSPKQGWPCLQMVNKKKKKLSLAFLVLERVKKETTIQTMAFR